MKKIAKTILVLVVGLIFCIDKVHAQETDVYFTSTNGIALTEKEYNFISEIYSEDYARNINQTQYNVINELDINNREVRTVTTTDENASLFPRATYVETAYKRLSISASCANDGLCTFIVVLRWLAIPSTRSYDNMGVRFSGNASLYSTNVTTTIEQDDTYKYCSNYKFRSNGFGCTFKLSETASYHLYMTQAFTVTGTGTVYASYQHASQALSSTAATQYSIALAGYGAVFDFYGDAVGKYDGMNGVEITI